MTINTAPSPHAPTSQGRPRRAGRRAGSGWFRAFWRWHFYASFLVIPVLLVLASTGLIYLFRFQIEPLVNADLMRVEVPNNIIAQPYQDAWAAAVNNGTASAYNGSGNTHGGSRFDYIFHSRVSALSLVSVKVPDTRVGGVYPSDHDPVVAVFRIN